MKKKMSSSADVIISYATRGRENYPNAFPRLIKTARAAGFTGDFILCAPEYHPVQIADGVFNEPGLPLPTHWSVPYGFKPELTLIAMMRGYKRVLWCDSTVVFQPGSADKVFETVSERGILAGDNPGCPESYWTSDDCLEAMGCSPDEAFKFSQVMACVLGFDFNSDGVRALFNEWLSFSRDGFSFIGWKDQAQCGLSTRPDFRGHRHDQSVISFLLHKYGVKAIPYGFVSYWDDRKEGTYLCNRGIQQE